MVPRGLSWLARVLAGLWLASTLVLAEQTVLRMDDGAPLTTSTTSLVDLLATSPNHTLLLRAVQRARLVPTLNRLNGSTFFAPHDDAIRRAAAAEQHDAGLVSGQELGSHGIWSFAITDELDIEKERDNLQLDLRDTILYHVLNYTTFKPPSLADDFPRLRMHESLYVPRLHQDVPSPSPPSLPGAPRDDPDPVDPMNATLGLLHGEGQKLRVLEHSLNVTLVGVDAKGEGGIRVIASEVQYAENGAFVIVDGTLSKPVDLASLIKQDPELSTFASLMTPPLLEYLSTAPHLTLFAPTNGAWDALSELEMQYLRSDFAEKDMVEIFGDSASFNGTGDSKVAYLERLLKPNGTDIITAWNDTLHLDKVDGQVKVNTTDLSAADIFAKNGVMHKVPGLLLPAGSLALTAEKYLIAMNCTRFVSLLRSVNLTDYIEEPSNAPVALDGQPSYTILAPRDDVFDFLFRNGEWKWENWWKSLPSAGSESLRQLLQYHIVAGRWTQSMLKDGMLLGTELRSDLLNGERQRLAVSIKEEPDMYDDDLRLLDENHDLIGFAGASVIGPPVKVGDSIIYLLRSVLAPPSSLITTAVVDLRLSTFVASIYAAAYEKTLDKTPAITYLAPRNDAFEKLGLVMSYLLLPEARTELREMLSYHAIDDIYYLSDFPNVGSHQYPTLSDDTIYVERSSNDSSLFVHGPTVGGLPANGDVRDAHIVEGDNLLSSGVLHIVDQVELPPTVDVGIAKLLKGARASTMARLLTAANMSWVLEGDPPPGAPSERLDGLHFDASLVIEEDDVDVAKKKHKKSKKKIRKHLRQTSSEKAYTLLCPTDRALSRINLTYYLDHPEALRELVNLHVLPTSAFAELEDDGRPLVLDDETTYASMLDKAQGGTSSYGVLGFRRWATDSYIVGVRGARGAQAANDWARVVAWGRATPRLFADAEGTRRLAMGGGVLLIDSVLEPYHPSWFIRWGYIVLVVIIGVASVVCVGLLVWKMWRTRKDQYIALEGEED